MSAPSFASFPDLDPNPRPSSDPPNPWHSGEDAKKKHAGYKIKQDKGKGKDKDKDKKRKRSNYTKANNLDDERLKTVDDAKRRDGDDFQHIFYSDRKGDPLNVHYGGLHAGDIPKYHLVGRGRSILGLSSAWTAIYRSGKGVEVGVGSRRKTPGLTDPSSRALLNSAPTRRVFHSGDGHKYEEIDGFLRIPSRRRRDNEQSYRSITLSKHDASSDSDSSVSERDNHPSSSDDDESDNPTITSLQATLKFLDQQLAADPASVATWLALLSHTLSTIPVSSKNATKARSEITLSILSRALSADPRNAVSKILRLKYLKAGENVWHESKVKAEWEDALKVGGIEIWMEWLEWRIRMGRNGINGVVEDARRVLEAQGADEESEIEKLRVFWRVTVAFQNAGFVERATALFQAQAELTFKIPQALYGLPLQTQLGALEEFWESDAPRVGESGAKGWAAWASSGRSDHVPILSSSNVMNDQEIPDLYCQWANQESYADRISRIPMRSTDDSETADSDPYAIILFSDIQHLLLAIHSPRAKNAFRLAWLSFLGLHIPGFSTSLSLVSQQSPVQMNWDDRWNCTHLTGHEYLTAIFPANDMQKRMAADAVAGALVGREKQYVSGFGPVRSWGYGVLEPLDVGLGSQRAGKEVLWRKEDVEGLDVGFIRGVFAQLRLGNGDSGWDVLALAFEAAFGVKSALKQSRSLLSTAPDSLPHWAAHAQLERMRGRIDDARKIYQAVLVASPLATAQAGASQLWWDWAEMEWLAGNPEDALRIVLRAAGVEGSGGVVILRAKRNLEGESKMVVDTRPWKEWEAWIKLRALLELLTAKEPTAALAIFDAHLVGNSSLSKGSLPHESLTVAYLIMLYQHGMVLKNPTPPSVLRERVDKALEVYPSNSVVLGLFLEGEKGQGVWGRVRGILGEGGGREKDVARRVEEVWIAGWERGRWEGEIERTRSGLAAAVENERTRGSSIVWRIYIEFEIRAGKLQWAKKMLFRAIGECPLVKELYLLAFGPLRSVFTPIELNGFADTMAERGLRMRRGLDELLEGWEDAEGRIEESEESGDEIERNAEELRRLMPF